MKSFAAVKLIFRILVFCFLTALTQVGGVIYLLHFSLYRFIDNKVTRHWKRRIAKLIGFVFLYTLFCFILIPFLAKLNGRVPLPLLTENHVRPLTIWTALLNRNYVKPELRITIFNVADEMDKKYPGTIVNYLDANFPFINGFPLFPHLSHSDGKKIDISFCYSNAYTLNETNEAPSFTGYGICEEPTRGEINTCEYCEQQGYFLYGLMRSITPQGSKKGFIFNENKTKDLVNFFAWNEAIGMIFIEPHLKTRMNLITTKVRFHGCYAVRHDDHIHVQLN